MIGNIKLNRLRPIALENLLAELRKRTWRGRLIQESTVQKLIVAMGYDHNGKRRLPQQKTVKPPEGLTQKQRENWLNEQVVLFERACKDTPVTENKSITLAEYVQI